MSHELQHSNFQTNLIFFRRQTRFRRTTFQMFRINFSNTNRDILPSFINQLLSRTYTTFLAQERRKKRFAFKKLKNCTIKHAFDLLCFDELQNFFSAQPSLKPVFFVVALSWIRMFVCFECEFPSRKSVYDRLETRVVGARVARKRNKFQGFFNLLVANSFAKS